MAVSNFIIEYHVEFGRSVNREFDNREDWETAIQTFNSRKTGGVTWTESTENMDVKEGIEVVGDITFTVQRESVKVLRAYEQRSVEAAANG